MTPPATPTAHATESGARPRPVDEFLSAFARGNPFSHHRVTASGAQPIDVPSIHDAEFRALVALAGRAHHQNETVGAVVWGESGSGKSNLLRRLGEWAAGGRAVLVNFLELQAAPDRLHRAVLNALVSVLTNGFAPEWHRTPLYRLLEGLVRPALAGKTSLSPAELESAFRGRVAGPVAEVGAAPATRAAVELLLRFLTDALTEKARKGDGAAAAIAARRLSGDGLDEDEARAVGLRPADAANPLDAADATRVLALLAQLARLNGLSLVVCFDQINTLPRQQIAEVSRLLHELNDRLRNTLLVLSEVRAELVKLTETGVISQATWDRLSANRVEVLRLTVAEGRRILEARLEEFLTPFEDVAQVNEHFKEDGLFPLGEAWFRERFKDTVDVRPRRVIDFAKERWEELQKSLDAAADGRRWLAEWPNVGPVKPPPRPVEELIDEQVGKAVAGRLARHAAAPTGLPPNADNLCGVAESLLAAGGVGLAVSRPAAGAYHLLVRAPGPDGRGETTTGVVFVTTGNATSVAGTLRRITADARRPARVLLVTDERVPLALGKSAAAKGREYYASLKAAAWFEHLELPFAGYAALEALDAVARQAGDLEIQPPGGPARAVTRDEVFASYRRTGRLKEHSLLGRFAGGAPVVAGVLTDVEVREFIVGRLAITVGTDTEELARQFLNELPADRRAGLDAAACRARIEAVAKTMAEAGGVTMSRLAVGHFLLPKRRPVPA